MGPNHYLYLCFSKDIQNCFSWWRKANPQSEGSHVSNILAFCQFLAAQAVPCKVRRMVYDVFAGLKGRWGHEMFN